MCKNNTAYTTEASKCIDWETFKQGTLSTVYRYRKNSRTQNIMKMCVDILKTDVFKLKEEWADVSKAFYVPLDDIRSILYYTRKVFKDLHCELDISVKENILNMLITVEVQKRFSPETLNIMRLERYGNISTRAVHAIYKLLDVYAQSAKPLTYKKVLDCLTIREFKVVTWYFSIIWTLERIQFVPLDVDTIARIDDAMRNSRYFLYKDQPLNPTVYNVCISICCNKLLTNVGNSTYGHDRIMYNIETGLLECAKTKTKTQKNAKKSEKKQFRIIPCNENPVLRIPLKGYMLIYQITAEKKKRYMHCPQCAAFHEYDYTNWTDTYKCEICVKKNSERIYVTCCMCNDRLSPKLIPKNNLIITDPTNADEPIQHLYFCKKHYRHARKMNTRLTKQQLFDYVTKKVTEQNRANAQIRY